MLLNLAREIGFFLLILVSLPLAILVVGTPIALVVRILLEIAARL